MAPYRRTFAILVGDGMADIPDARLGNQTPLEYASTPAMDAVATSGGVGRVETIPAGFLPGSDVGNLSLLGYDPARYYTGRAPIEAAGLGIALRANDVAIRCNLVFLDDDLMGDYSAGHLEPAEAAALIASLKPIFDGPGATLHLGVDYRHCYVVAGLDVADMHSTPPHDITGRPWRAHLPTGGGAEKLTSLMERSVLALANHPVNRRRKAAGKTPANSAWLWGQGRAMALPSLRERFGLTGSVISAVDLVKGLGLLAGLSVAAVEGATGYLGTNYRGKMAAAVSALDKQDFVYLHVEAPDETSHEGDLEKKIRAIEEFDKNIVAEFLALQRQTPGLRILVTPDHITALSTKTHAMGAVPFTVSGEGIAGGRFKSYSEVIASSAPSISGAEMFERLIRGTF
jgi:2,3-bisphosphoglycerate-independent phosphoglycerate mutase